MEDQKRNRMIGIFVELTTYWIESAGHCREYVPSGEGNGIEFGSGTGQHTVI